MAPRRQMIPIEGSSEDHGLLLKPSATSHDLDWLQQQAMIFTRTFDGYQLPP
jgi:hypothetical protein